MTEIKVSYLTDDVVREELRALEAEHGMTTQEFYEKYNRGEMGDSEYAMRWASLYDMLMRPAKPPPKRRRVKA